MSSPFESQPNVVAAIAKIYDQDEDTLWRDVETLREWMKTQPHLPEILDAKIVCNFLILNKCSIERTKQRLDMYYTIRSLIPDVYDNINPKSPNVCEIMDNVYWIPLPKLTKEMHRVMMYKMRNKEFIDRKDPYNAFRMLLDFQELRLNEDVMFGDLTVFDMDGINFGYITKLTPTFLAKCLAVYEKVFSIPLKGIIIVNSPPFINTVIAILKTLMKPKLFERIKVCKDTSILAERFPKEMIPSDYGGEEKSLEELHGLWKDKMAEYQNRFDDLDKLRVDESKRPTKLENDDVLGFHGNFKKLNVD